MIFPISVAAVFVFLMDLEKFLHVQGIIPLYAYCKIFPIKKNFFSRFCHLLFHFISHVPLAF